MDLEILFKRTSPNATIPKYAKPGDAGMDLTAISCVINHSDGPTQTLVVSYDTGLAVEIPEGYVGLVFPRSSIYKTKLTQCNAVGVIDSSYRGSIIIKHYLSIDSDIYEIGDRVAQLIILPYPKIKLVEVNELTETDRGTGGFGSTENKEKR